MCLDYFTIMRGGKTFQKMELPRPLLHGKTSLTTTNIIQSGNSVAHHAFIHQLGVFVNTLQKEILEGTIVQQPNRGSQYLCASGYKGPHTSQLSHLPISKYYVTKDVDLKLFTQNEGNIPLGKYLGWNQPQQQDLNLEALCIQN
jgi:hypothetical protein